MGEVLIKKDEEGSGGTKGPTDEKKDKEKKVETPDGGTK
jgi:hypothetical protein